MSEMILTGCIRNYIFVGLQMILECGSYVAKKKNMCVSGFPTYPNFFQQPLRFLLAFQKIYFHYILRANNTSVVFLVKIREIINKILEKKIEI